ncbi:hypothetical protein BN871_HG_00010, partial [Paenibacillus sp. P22]
RRRRSMKALIVDDEIYAVKGLMAGVSWQEAGIDEVYEAYHADMAKEMLRKHDIDIMICDIEMPEQSGLELMEWVKEEGMRLETVVLTCHSEFRYAQKALQLGGRVCRAAGKPGQDAACRNSRSDFRAHPASLHQDRQGDDRETLSEKFS